MTVRVIHVPDMGDIESAEVIELLLKPGDSFPQEHSALVLESDKAAFDVPAEHGGELLRWLVKEGDSVTSGSPLAEVEVGAEAEIEVEEETAETNKPHRTESEQPTVDVEPSPAPMEAAADPAPHRPVLPGGIGGVYAGPGVRRLARELGVELSAVAGTGVRGRIRREDIHQHVRTRLATPPVAGDRPRPALPDPSAYGPFHSEPLTRMQRAVSTNLQLSWGHIPHVTQHEEADVTELEQLRKQLRDDGGPRLTPLAFLVRACARVLSEFPHLRSWYDAEAQQLLVLDYCDIGIAVDTDEGLLVPVLRAADSQPLADIATSIAELAERARNRQLRPVDMRGGCFSISNLGGIGGTAFSPIINLPQVAILGVSRTRRVLALKAASRQRGAVEERLLMPLSLSYDHRVVNGAEAARFVSALSERLAAPQQLLDAD